MVLVIIFAAIFLFGFGFEYGMKKIRHNKKKDVLLGRLQVTGRDEIEVFFEGKPNHVHVRFEDDQSSVPCNPGTTDTLDWCLDEHHHESCLKIKWDVSGARVICWEIKYKC